MQHKVSLAIEIILHATEDLTKIEKSLNDTFDTNFGQFEKEEIDGHFGNPITILKTKIAKNDTKKIISILISKISSDDLEILEKKLDEMDKNLSLIHI